MGIILSPFSPPPQFFLDTNNLSSVDMHFGAATAVPRREQDATATTLVLHILHRAHEVRDAAETGKAAQAKRPGVCGVASHKRRVGKGALAARGAVGGRGAPLEVGNGHCVLELLAGHLLWRHAWGARGLVVGLYMCGLWLWLWLHVLLLRLAVGSVHGRLRVTGGFWRLGIGLHGNTLLLHCAGLMLIGRVVRRTRSLGLTVEFRDRTSDSSSVEHFKMQRGQPACYKTPSGALPSLRPHGLTGGGLKSRLH
jgi:hypothetical protein